ncbi:quinone-dependent dihydroorotate dehydrogenase [Paraconexibacter algicola]|uniref:Dihydroorotate dehydrogenase (quinone) n=1 Tax=Paraconexibacter algicola TaxID=2133960 RepID=A0A2T4UCF3_9ACTN|nr:quinone-dependent dihydroorotate dehydrogenase [Paraconexibacter algicola]PTL54897.1 dihydroorotate dehydrogenase (quinone) [Paraconexibacter algicola]
MIWRALFRLVLVRVDAETAHRLGTVPLRLAGRLPGLARLLGPRDPRLQVRAFGLTFPSPVGLAAGFDKDAELVDGLLALGFGSVEVGTVTAEGQPGNPRPRLVRLPADRALVNRMGFNNRGAAVAEGRLRARRRTGAVVGVNLGKTKLATDAVADYVASARRLAPLADYVVLNVSSPNTPGLRDLQAVAQLGELVRAVRPVLDGRPLLVKIAPDLSDEDVDAVAELALAERLDGIIATNTTITRDGLRSTAAEVEAAGAGGLSGAPVAARSLEVLRRLRARVGEEVVLVSVGGIETPQDAWDRLQAGATLVQAYTGFVYGGPLWPCKMHRGLSRRLDAAGLGSVAEITQKAGKFAP